MWNPIETAPLDGQLVWLLVDSDRYLGFFDPPDNVLHRKGAWTLRARVEMGVSFPSVLSVCHRCKAGEVPTHWLPIPGTKVAKENTGENTGENIA